MAFDSRIFVTGPMKAELRPEFIGTDTEQALYDYQDACKARIHSKMKYFGEMYSRLHGRDVAKAIESLL